ncbi:hypothetical protein [Mycobacterium sp. HUMS_1102779]|uniref:hypothetical protein n=1 Tax=Mycobacterium sp. HUMS_1102779 TaxID=3383487 RepID=UPI00389A0BE8
MFLELLKANDRDAIVAEARRNPGIVVATWERGWATTWDGRGWKPSSDDHGFGRVRYATWVRAFRAAGYCEGVGHGTDWVCHEIKPATPPDEPILLYRAAPVVRRLGMSWTSDYDEAVNFSNYNGAGKRQCVNIYAHWAFPEELLAYIYKWNKRWEWPYGIATADEYVLDPKFLDDDNVEPVSVPMGNYSDTYLSYVTPDRPATFGLLTPP